MAVRITRLNPRTGRVERPWLNRDRLFVLGDPAHGAQKHHDKFAVKVPTISEAAALVGKGFSIRMTDGETPPALISPDALSVEEVDEADAAPLWTEMAAKPPFSKDEMMGELRLAMLVQANQIAHAGGPDYAEKFMGFEPTDPLYPYCGEEPTKVDLDRFRATAYLDRAYDYAFQVGSYWLFGDDTVQNVNEFIRGANLQASNGKSSPLANPNGLCRHAADMAFARWKLEKGHDLTARELALLGQISEPAARNSLSKERIAIEKGQVDGTVALVWLQERRDFIPTRTDAGHQEQWKATSRFLLERRSFGAAFAEILRNYPMSAKELARRAKVKGTFVDALVAGRPSPELDALLRVGQALDLDPPQFAGAAVQATLRQG